MTIAIDIDEVIYPFSDTVLSYLSDRVGVVTPLELYGDITATESGIPDKVLTQHVHDFQLSHHSLAPSPIHGAVSAIDVMSRDHDLVLLTSRDPSLKPITHKWLGGHFGDQHFQDVIFVGNHWMGGVKKTKADVCREIDARYLIEDQPRYVELFNEHPTTVIFFGEYDWNRDYVNKSAIRAKNWTDVLGHISSV